MGGPFRLLVEYCGRPERHINFDYMPDKFHNAVTYEAARAVRTSFRGRYANDVPVDSHDRLLWLKKRMLGANEVGYKILLGFGDITIRWDGRAVFVLPMNTYVHVRRTSYTKNT